jgi:sterol desaturase/sphingolipid hydroxylase (fatty acid hydroxylase superfamily)
MSNARTFVWLFVYVQAAFIAVDLYEHWRLARKPGRHGVISANAAVILAVGAACVGYSAIQLALASALPSIDKLSDFAIRVTGSAAAAPSVPWMVPVFAIAFCVGTLFDYLVHRFLLHGPLWRLHENHHLPSVVSNVMPGIAARPFVIVPNFLINVGSCATVFLVVRLIGRPHLSATFLHLLPALLLTFTFVACASHSIFLRRFDWVETSFRWLLLVGPREHLLHHAAKIKGNYGNFTMVWDSAFGTYVSPPRGETPLGLDYDQDFLGAITAGRFKLSPGFRSRYQVGRVCRLVQDEIDNPVAE